MKRILALLIVMLGLTSLGILPVQGQDVAIILKSSTVQNQFPDGVMFTAEVETVAPEKIKEIKLEMGIKGSGRSSYDYLEFTPDTRVQGEYLLRASGAQYKPVGSLIEYRFVVTDTKGRILETERKTHLYIDNRFEWAKVSAGTVEVYYYGPTKTRAELILKASTDTIAKMGALMGLTQPLTVRVVGYNNYAHMVVALPPQAKAVQTELITQGQAWSEYGVFVMLAGDARADGVASHELTHMVVREATRAGAVNIPAWLNEGLAEYANVNPGIAYDQVLSEAISSGRLFRLRQMQNPPGIPRDTLQFYGQSRSVVKHLVDAYGDDKVKRLFSAFREGLQIDEALKKAYGFDQDGLDNSWRRSLGLPEVAPLPAMTPAPSTPTPPPTGKATKEPATTKPGRSGGFGCAAPLPAR